MFKNHPLGGLEKSISAKIFSARDDMQIHTGKQSEKVSPGSLGDALSPLCPPSGDVSFNFVRAGHVSTMKKDRGSIPLKRPKFDRVFPYERTPRFPVYISDQSLDIWRSPLGGRSSSKSSVSLIISNSASTSRRPSPAFPLLGDPQNTPPPSAPPSRAGSPSRNA